MLLINLNRDYKTQVDDEDFEYLNQFKWYATKYKENHVYAVRHDPDNHPHLISMHRMLMKEPKGKMVDHKDGNTLNNQKNNLREATHLENKRNSKKHKRNQSGYKGVYKVPSGKWRAQIYVNKERIILGHYVNLISAAKAYDKAARRYFGEFARINCS